MASPLNKRVPGATEHVAAAAVLAVLAAVLVFVVIRQNTFNPAVMVATIAADHAVQAPIEVVAPTPDLLDPWPAGIQAMTAAEHFTPVTLSDKIDGKAELYFPAGFVALACQRLTLTASPGTWIELFVFDMGQPANAFSVFSAQRRHRAEEVAIGDYAYRSENQLCLVHGRFYLELVATDAREITMHGTIELARAFVETTAVADHADVGSAEALFPVEHLRPETVTLLSADVFGFDGLQNVFVARYRDGADEATLFLTRRDSPAEAAQLADDFCRFLIHDCGGEQIQASGSASSLVVIDLGGVFDGVFTSGPFVAGVHEAASPERAALWSSRLRESLEGSTR